MFSMCTNIITGTALNIQSNSHPMNLDHDEHTYICSHIHVFIYNPSDNCDDIWVTGYYKISCQFIFIACNYVTIGDHLQFFYLRNADLFMYIYVHPKTVVNVSC